MKEIEPEKTDIMIVGAGPVGLMCAYLGQICDLKTIIIDKSKEPLKVGKADALNARTLQLLETVGLFKDIYPIGKTCNTSSVWSNGRFISRQSSWWEELEGCFHKHFLMLGQAYIEQLLDKKLKDKTPVWRSTTATDVKLVKNYCQTKLANGKTILSKYVIAADGSRSFIRKLFDIKFEITKPQIIWAVIDGVIETSFPKVPEIIVFQTETSDVAWIPREGDIDRFYVRVDTSDFNIEQILTKINKAMQPHSLKFKKIIWFSSFSVKESVAEKFFTQNRIFLAGDACHIHSVNGGQGLNTGIGDAFNLIWKLSMVIKFGAPASLLHTYESERKPVAMSVVATSGELVRSTKYSKKKGMHAQDYVNIIKKRAGNITGMGISYGDQGVRGSRLFDFVIYSDLNKTRVYSLLDYRKFTLLVFHDCKISIKQPKLVRVLQIFPHKKQGELWTEKCEYTNQILLVRPDSYIEFESNINEAGTLLENLWPQR